MSDFNFGDLYTEATTLITGTFDGICVEATPAESSNGKPMIKVKLQVEGGPHHGKTFFTQLVVSKESQAAMRMFFTRMTAFGFQADYWSKNPGMAQVASDMAGKRLRFKVGTRTWQGVERENVDEFMPPLTGTQNIPAPGIGRPNVGPGSGPSVPPPSISSAPSVPSVPSTPPVAAPVAPPVVKTPDAAPVSPPSGAGWVGDAGAAADKIAESVGDDNIPF